MDTAIASPRPRASNNAEPTSTHQCGRRSRTTTSFSLSSRRGNATGVARYWPAGALVGGAVACVVDVVARVVVGALLVVVRAVVVVCPVVLVAPLTVVVVCEHGVLPTEPATWNGTWTTFETTLSP